MATAFSNRYGLKQVGLRYMNVYGPRQDYHGAYIVVIMKMLVGTGVRTSLKELAEKLVELTGFKQPIQYQERSQATLVTNRVGCPKRAAEEIGFEAQTGLDEGLAKLIEWRTKHKAAVAARRKAVGYVS